ncbi:MAG TPA: hypothetical protein V6D08_03165 [Candidatus Obscuribacterales bacterium]
MSTSVARPALTLLIAFTAARLLLPGQARADVISPHINDHGRVYSDEPPNSALYGTGMSGRMSEASALRFEGEQDLQTRNLNEAVRKLGKAVQLDPGYPPGHVLYARAITAKFYANKGPIDEDLLRRCIDEWKLIWRHDADQLEQMEARSTARKLIRIAKAIEKKKKEQAKALLAEQRRVPEKDRWP